MKQTKHLRLAITLLVIFVFTSACGLFDVAARTVTPAAPTQDAGQVTQPPAVTQTPAPADTAQAPAETSTPAVVETQPSDEPADTGFVVFHADEKEFRIYSLTGELRSRIPAPGFEALSHDQVDVVGNNIYYYAQNDGQIYLANEFGLQALVNQPAVKPFAFKISPDEKQIAWSVVDWNSQPLTSELWVGQLDGSSATQVATYNSDQSPAFLFLPIEWTADGKVLINRSPTGFGGYILYGGYNSLYSYDPATQEFVTYVPAEELHGLCLDNYRIDLNRVAFNCGPSGSQITIRNLADGSSVDLPSIPDYPITGSARFSPSGAWLAYAAAHGNPDAEGGVLAVQPADLSAGPEFIASVDNGYFSVKTWLDESTILATRTENMTETTVFRVQRDGSGAQDLAAGWFVMMTP